MDGFFLDDSFSAGETLAKLKAKIEPYFDIVAENVSGTHPSGRSPQLDALAKPKPALIKDGFADITVGLYLRDPLQGPTAARDVPRKAKELIDLAHTRYGEHGGLPLILVYPGFFAHLRADQKQKLGEAANLFERVMAQFNIGEIKPEAANLVIMYNGARYWDSVFGLNNDRSYTFTPLVF